MNPKYRNTENIKSTEVSKVLTNTFHVLILLISVCASELSTKASTKSSTKAFIKASIKASSKVY